MIGSDLEGADLENRVASWAASAISDDAAAVRAVIEAYGDRLAAADVAGTVSQYTRNTAVMQPELQTVVGSQQLTATYAAAFDNMRLDFTFRFDDITVKGDLAAVRATSQDHDPRYRRDATSASPAAARSGTHGATGKSRSTCTSRCRSSQEGAAPASSESSTRLRARSAAACVTEHDAAPATPTSTCPYRGRAGRRRRSRSRPCACSWGAGAAGGHGSRPLMH